MSQIPQVAGQVSAAIKHRAATHLSVGILLAVGMTWVPAAARADDDNLRCGNRLAAVGMISAQVAALCGVPDYRDSRITPGLPPPLGGEEEIWYYNHGPGELVRQLRFRNDRLWRIRTDGYGFNPDPNRRCTPDDLYVGESKFRLVTTCGDPASRRVESLWLPLAEVPVLGPYSYPQGGFVAVYREHWIYNFGPDLLLREVIVDNDQVTQVKTGDAGFAMPP